MTFDEFETGISRLEKIFNAGLQIDAELRLEYFEALKYVRADVYREAVQLIVETFRPFPSEPFPAISTIDSAILETRESAGAEAGWEARRQSPLDTRTSDYCQRCGQVGFYLADDGLAHFCACEKGRLKRVSWRIDAHARKRAEKIQKALEKLPPSLGPVRGLHEWNPLGFWELNVMEHERFMVAKRAEIEEIERREAERPERSTLPDDLRRKLLKDTVAGIRGQMPEPAAREPGEDEEDEDIVPF
jgi:hypothetical protein